MSADKFTPEWLREENSRLLDNAATCSQSESLLEDVTRECIVINIVNPLRRAHADALEQLASLKAQLAEMTQAVGLASTIKGEMPMRPDDPVGMMQEVVTFVGAMSQQLAKRDAELVKLKAHAEAMAEGIESSHLEIEQEAWAAYRSAYPEEKNNG